MPRQLVEREPVPDEAARQGSSRLDQVEPAGRREDDEHARDRREREPCERESPGDHVSAPLVAKRAVAVVEVPVGRDQRRLRVPAPERPVVAAVQEEEAVRDVDRVSSLANRTFCALIRSPVPV